MAVRHSSIPVLIALTFIGLCVAIQTGTGAYMSDRGLTGDEASHFVNSLLVLDYFRQAFPGNPISFARDYYVHLPRVSIGHWPPAFYVVQATIFALAGRSSAVAIAFQAVIAGLTATTVAVLIRSRIGTVAGFAAGLTVLASPTLLLLLDAVMLDTAMSLLVLWAGLFWAKFAERPAAWPAIGFALCAIIAILTKGNGFGLALLPLFHAAFTRTIRPLLTWQAWLAAAAVALCTLPWHLITFRMQSAGFNYAFGWDYTGRALRFYAAAGPHDFGIVCLAGFVIGLATVVWNRAGSRRDPMVAAMASGALAMTVFALIAPADLSARYFVPVLPSAVVVSAMGLAWTTSLVGRRPVGSRMLTAGLLLANAMTIVRLPHVAPFGMRNIARHVLERSGNPVVLVAGSTRAEGALIAAFAELDPTRTHYVLRATQQLAGGNFMGTRIASRFASVGEVGHWLDESGIGWLVLANSAEDLEMEQNRQILAVMQRQPPGWKIDERQTIRDGEVDVYRHQIPPPTSEQLEDLSRRAMPSTG